MLRKPKRLKPRLRDVDGTEYDPDTGEKINSEAIVTLPFVPCEGPIVVPYFRVTK